MDFVFSCFPELQESSQGVLKSPFHGHFKNQEMDMKSSHNFLTLQLAQRLPLVASDSLRHPVSLPLVPEISLPGIFHSPFWSREDVIGNYSL